MSAEERERMCAIDSGSFVVKLEELGNLAKDYALIDKDIDDVLDLLAGSVVDEEEEEEEEENET